LRRALLIAAICVAGFARAAAFGEWSQPAMVFDGAEAIGHPAIAADGADRIVLVWTVYSGSDPQSQHLYGAALRGGDSWSTPRAILDGPTTDVPVLAADPFAELHLLWDSTLARADYGRLFVDPAAGPAHISGRDVADSNDYPFLWAGADGRLHLVYGERGTSGVAYRSSADGGGSWSAPVQIAPPSMPTRLADYARLAGSDDGVLHVVWSEFDRPGGSPVGVFYARSTDGGATWSPAVPLAGPGANQVNVASSGNHAMHVVWNGTHGAEGRYHRWSNDGGITWWPAQQIVDRGTADGLPQVMVDSAGALHLITAYDGDIWHAAWDGGQWSEPECVSCSGTKNHQQAGEPAAIVVDGNVLHVAYGLERHQLLHTIAQLPSPRRTPPPPLRVGWWSDRFWHRDLERVPALLGIIASIALVRTVRRARTARVPR
jgi:hypothetical protein